MYLPGFVIVNTEKASPAVASTNVNSLSYVNVNVAPRIPGLFFTFTATSTVAPGESDTDSTIIIGAFSSASTLI